VASLFIATSVRAPKPAPSNVEPSIDFPVCNNFPSFT